MQWAWVKENKWGQMITSCLFSDDDIRKNNEVKWSIHTQSTFSIVVNSNTTILIDWNFALFQWAGVTWTKSRPTIRYMILPFFILTNSSFYVECERRRWVPIERMVGERRRRRKGCALFLLFLFLSSRPSLSSHLVTLKDSLEKRHDDGLW